VRDCCNIEIDVPSDFVPIFQQEYRALRPRAPLPPLTVRFRRFTSLNTTIRLREGQIFVSLSDLLEGAPESVIRSIAHILLAKLYKKPIEAAQSLRYKRFASSAAVTRQTELIRHTRVANDLWDPKAAFSTWRRSSIRSTTDSSVGFSATATHMERTSRQAASRPLRCGAQYHRGEPRIRSALKPAYAIEYLLYHEMLHLKHPVRMRGLRRCVHSRDFKADEAQFPQLTEALAFIKRL